MFNLLRRIGEFNKNHTKMIKIVITITAFSLGYLTNILIANGILYINHYISTDDYDVEIIGIAPQYNSPTQKNFTVIVKNEWLNDLATKMEIYSKPSNSEITFAMLCDNVPCQNVITIEKQSFKTITVAMMITSNVDQSLSICVKASEYGKEENSNEPPCSQSYVMTP